MDTHTRAGWEDLAGYQLDEPDAAELLERQTECTLIWIGRDGHPIGVVVNFLHLDGRFWLTATSARPRVAAIRSDPRVSIAVSSKGSGIRARRSFTCKGIARVHADAQTRAWFLPVFAAHLRPGDPERATAFARSLDSPLRVVIEVVPLTQTTYDGAKMWATNVPAAAAPDDPTWSLSQPVRDPGRGTFG